VAVDDALVDALVDLRPQLRTVYFVDPPAVPEARVVERLLMAGLEVDGVSSTPESAARFAHIVVENMARAEDEDGAEEPTGPGPGDTADSDAGVDGAMRSLIVEDDLDALIAGGRPVLVDLTATWCGPCQVLKPILHEIGTELAEQVTIVAVDVDDAPWTEPRFGVQAIPTIVLLDEGRELGRIVGAHPKRTLLTMIEAALPSVSVSGRA